MHGVDLSHSQPGAAGWFVQSFHPFCGWVLVRLVRLFWPFGGRTNSSCHTWHSAILKLYVSHMVTSFMDWLLVVHGKHEGVLGQQAILVWTESNRTHLRAHLTSTSSHKVTMSSTRKDCQHLRQVHPIVGQAHLTSGRTGWQGWDMSSLMCVCVRTC